MQLTYAINLGDLTAAKNEIPANATQGTSYRNNKTPNCEWPKIDANINSELTTPDIIVKG
jgi:hypothetical protein